MKFIQQMIKKFVDACRGLWFVAKNELSFRLELFGGVVLLFCVFWYFEKMEPIEALALIVMYGLILVAELGNTALETALERLHPERHDLIGLSKDIAAGTVLMAGGLFTLVLLYVIFV